MSAFTRAFSLSKEEVKQATPLGTITTLEYDTSDTNEVIILRPQPTKYGRDPLNWPTWRKLSVLACMSLFGFVANFTASSISSALPLYATPLVFNPPVPGSQLSQLLAINILMLGVANIWWVPLSNCLGRRPVVLLGLLVLTLCSVWAEKADNYNSLLAARLFMGIGGAPADTVAPKVVSEMFFVHQSGRAMGIYTAFLCIGPTIGGISGGYIADRLGISWLHWINIILSACLLVLCFFFQAETLFDRDEITNQHDIEQDNEEKVSKQEIRQVEQEEHQSLVPYTYLESLGFQKPRRLSFREIFAAVYTLRLPGVWLVMFWYAGLVGGVVTVSSQAPQLLAQPPYLWGENAGLINVSGLVGAVLGVIFTYLMADRVVKPRKQGEFYVMEAEARLPVAFPGLILATTGLWVFGFCAQNPSPNAWIGMEFGNGMLTFGLMQVPSIGFNYLIESYTPIAGDCFTAVTLMRAIVSFAWTFFVGVWMAEAGPAVPFGVFGGMMGLFSVLVIPIWIWGKRLRIMTTEWLQ